MQINNIDNTNNFSASPTFGGQHSSEALPSETTSLPNPSPFTFHLSPSSPSSSSPPLPFTPDPSPSLWDQFRDKFHNGPAWFQQFRDKFTLHLNIIGIVFNSLAVVKDLFPKKLGDFFDTKSEWFSRYLIPFGFAWNSLEALVGNRLIESITRMIPALSFWCLPFYNFNIATGVSSGLSYLFEHVKSRHGGQNPGETMAENAKSVISTSMDILKDIFTGNRSTEDFKKQLGTLFLLGGSMGGMLFANKDRDSWLARLFGNLRNVGGLVADWELIFNDDPNPSSSKDKRLVGGSCITASILNIFMRWVKNPELARAFNHISIALDDFGLTYWAQSSKRDNDAKKKIQTTNLIQAPQRTVRDFHMAA